MAPEFSGIERRLDELNERLRRLGPLRNRPRTDFDADPYLRDIAERNLEIAAQCCIDICHRIISIENAKKPTDYHDAILRMSELGVLTPDFARSLATIAGFRNILVHGYFRLSHEDVWRIVEVHVPVLLRDAQALLASFDPPESPNSESP